MVKSGKVGTARLVKRLLLLSVVLAVCFAVYWKLAIPVHHFPNDSELIMLGDLDGDERWTADDLERLEAMLKSPFDVSPKTARLMDLNQNELLDDEDIAILHALVEAGGDPYAAQENADAAGSPFPRPRELYRYVPIGEYVSRPAWALPYTFSDGKETAWLASLPRPNRRSDYADALNVDIYAEAVRFDHAWRQRRDGLMPLEREYASGKLAKAAEMSKGKENYGVLLALMELVEDAETLTVQGQPDISLRLLQFRDHLRDVLVSPQFMAFKSGKGDRSVVFELIEDALRTDLEMDFDLETLGKPRDYLELENYVQRLQWQYYKSMTDPASVHDLVKYAQNDPRYLRAVSKTSRKHQDMFVENHNLPMVLLYREALRISGGDKKKAVALLDECIRIPFAWMKFIPSTALPSSVALENFLLPGNKEDGADKSRHWNVFGGICLYKSPQESVELALRREVQDLREGNDGPSDMAEFLRDMIANLNGMYHVLAVDPGLLQSKNSF